MQRSHGLVIAAALALGALGCNHTKALEKRAAFDLSCQQLQYTCLEERFDGACLTMGVEGCGRKATYVWVQTGQDGSYKWLMNSVDGSPAPSQ